MIAEFKNQRVAQLSRNQSADKTTDEDQEKWFLAVLHFQGLKPQLRQMLQEVRPAVRSEERNK